MEFGAPVLVCISYVAIPPEGEAYSDSHYDNYIRCIAVRVVNESVSCLFMA